MSNARADLLEHRLVLATLLAIAALAGPRSAADEAVSREFPGACYCRAGDELICAADLTVRECDLRSRQFLCDEWFWKERLPCWNWGYGG